MKRRFLLILLVVLSAISGTTQATTCYNCVNGGSIGYNQNGCSPFDPANIQNIQLPSGGSGALYYQWYYKNNSTNQNWTAVSGATSSTYNPGIITETTQYARYARRIYCTSWSASNAITMTVTTCCNATINGLVVYNLNNNSNALTVVNGGVYSLSNFPTNWNLEALVSGTTAESVVFTISGSANATNTENVVPFRAPGDAVALNLSAGTYTVNIKVYSQDNAGGLKCAEENISFTLTPPCALDVNAGADVTLCTPTKTLTAISTGASTCTTQTITDCNHPIANSGGWLADLATAGVCGDAAGAKLWTLGGSGTSYITLDLGMNYAAGTQICVNMKLEHCVSTSSGLSNAKIQASTSATTGFTNLISSVTFSHTNYQEYCYTLTSAARYIKVSDNGSCALRVDYVKTVIPGTSNSTVNYSWSGPGIVGASNTASVNVNQAGTYIVTATDCKGCADIDTVKVETCCNLNVNAGADIYTCSPLSQALSITASSTGAATCTTQTVTDCNHPIANSGGWLADLATAGVCGDAAGAKLWTLGGSGTSYITLDLGMNYAAGTQICVNMKLEHCVSTSSGLSNAKIQASTSATTGFANLISSITFSHTNYQEYCYTLTSAARYIRVSDNGSCALRVDYVKTVIPGTNNSGVNYSWSGPGIVGPNNTASINVNQQGDYIVTATDCRGCVDIDTVKVVINNPNDNNACTNDYCDPATGTVTHTPISYDDNDVCTTDACDPVTGVSHTPISYDDNDVCTTDACDHVTGVSHTPISYDDNDVCTTDACDPVTGVSHTPISYDDNDVCTTDACDPVTGVSHTPISYDDNDVCTTDACDPVTGVSHTPISYDDNDVCTTDACDPVTGVSHTPISYDDNDVCTTDACDPITGVSHTPISYDDNDVCTTDACDPITGVSHTPISYDDNDVCTTDACDPVTGVSHTPISYDDSDVCTTDACDPITGVSHTPISYDDNDVCTTDACDPVTGLSHTPISYDDNDVCTTDACDPVTGVSHTPISYDDNDVCTTDACDPVTGVSHTPISYDDNDVCTTDACDPITGVSHTPISYDDNDVCTTDACDPITGVSHTPISYDDNDVCTTDACDPATGVSHTPISYDDNDVCTTDACDPITGVSHTPIAYDDNNVCTIDACDPITGPSYTPVNIDDNNLCTTDGCDPVTGVFHNPVQGLSCFINGGNTCCQGDPVQLCVPSSVGATSYLWSTGATTRCIEVYTSGTYSVTISDANGCTSTCDKTVTFYPTPEIQMPVFVNVCDTISNGVLLSGATPAGGTYSGNGVVNGVFYPSLAGVGTHYIYYEFDNGHCSNIDSALIEVVNCVCELPLAPQVSGLLSVCRGGQASYVAVGATGATNYVWTVTGGATIVYGQGTDSVVVQFSCQTCTGGTICVTAKNDCGDALPVCVPFNLVLANPVLSGTINGPVTEVCVGSVFQYCIAAAPTATNYIWTLPANTQIISGDGTNCIQLQILPGFVSGNLSVKAQNCKGLSGSKTISLKSLPLQPAAITGKASALCGNTGVVYSIAPITGATGYNWIVPAGASIVNGQNTTSIVVDFGPGFVSGNVSVNGTNACGAGPQRHLAVKAKASIPSVVNGPLTVCANDAGVAYSVTGEPGVTYTWTVPAGAVITSGQGTNAITVSFGSANGNIKVVPSNSCGASAAKQIAVTVTVCARVFGAIQNDEKVVTELVNVYPNPAKNDVTVKFNSTLGTHLSVVITDVIGKVVYTSSFNAADDNNQIIVNVSDLPKGLYMVTLNGVEYSKTMKITKE